MLEFQAGNSLDSAASQGIPKNPIFPGILGCFPELLLELPDPKFPGKASGGAGSGSGASPNLWIQLGILLGSKPWEFLGKIWEEPFIPEILETLPGQPGSSRGEFYGNLRLRDPRENPWEAPEAPPVGILLPGNSAGKGGTLPGFYWNWFIWDSQIPIPRIVS